MYIFTVLDEIWNVIMAIMTIILATIVDLGNQPIHFVLESRARPH